MKSPRKITIAIPLTAAVALAALVGAGAGVMDDDPAAEGPAARNPAMVDLGRRLFFDPILSADGSISCASCHNPKRAFADGRARSLGIHGRETRRNAPSILDRAVGTSQFWDGRVATLEEQALHPIISDVEMGSTVEDAVARLQADAEYREAFRNVFDDEITAERLAEAIAAFERTLVSGDSPADRFMRSEFSALSDEARKGKWIFESNGQCWRCHSGANFTDERFHNTGVSFGAELPDLGRFEVTGDEADLGRFKTPSLRNVALTAPYMHDGSIATLRDVVEFYVKGGEPNPNLDPIMRPLELSEEEIDAVVAFLEALTSDQLPEGEERPGSQENE